MKKLQVKTLSLIALIALVGCSKTDQPSPAVQKHSDELIKRISDTKEICESMKLELVKMKKKIDSKEPESSVSGIIYKRELPDIYLKHSAEFIKVCGVHQ
jgi:hypothetical protein